jgi:hypothetical protein
MNAITNALRDIGHTIVNSQLVLNLLRGLKPHFSSTSDDITDSDPLLDIAMDRDKLVLKELSLTNEGKVTS